ncbi:MAG TPA: hypothetical protein VM120_02270 [Bryobacteraceae bacterium]|nr:hypothetical protein [Bryobacteraceae bacterium]
MIDRGKVAEALGVDLPEPARAALGQMEKAMAEMKRAMDPGTEPAFALQPALLPDEESA